MPQKLNKAGQMQDYIPKGNGDASGEYGTSNGTNKNFTTSDKKSNANVITENKSVVVENKGKKEKEKPFDIDTLDVSLRKKVESGEITLKDASRELAKAGWYNFIPSEEETKKALGIKDNKANIIDGDLTGKKDNYNKALDDLKQWETFYDDDMDARTSKADARDKYIKNSDYVNEDTKLQNEYVFESMKGKDVNKIYDLIKETGVDPKSIYEKGNYPDAEFLVREKILKLIKDGKVKIDYSKKKIPTYGGRDVSSMVVGTLMENMRYEFAYGNKFKNK